MDVTNILSHYFPEFNEHSMNDSFVTLCAFHEEDTGSMKIDLDTGRFYCFGCGKSGDIYDIIAEIDQVNRLQAMLKAHRLKGNSSNRNIITIKKSNKDWLSAAKVEFKSCIRPNWYKTGGNHYMKERGFTAKTLTEFDVRLDPFSGYPVVIGLFENRKFCGIVKRRIDNSAERKYLYNKGFRRQSCLIGRFEANKKILVTEGCLDMMKAWQGGFRNVVCLLGWKPSKYQIEMLKKNTSTIISALDNTPTGEEGTKILKEYFNIERFPFPDYRKDLGEMSTYEVKFAYQNLRRK